MTLSHTFSGNAKAFSEWLADNTDCEVGFVCDDPTLFKLLKKKSWPKKIRLLSLHSLSDLKYIAGSKAICTTHGPAFLRYWKSSKNRPIFVGVWHGVGFKGSNDNHAKSLAFYEAHFVSSPYFKGLHEKWGFNKNRLFVTGYARTDKLCCEKLDKINKVSILRSYGIDTTDKKVVLFAPTWRTASEDDSKILGQTMPELINKLGMIAKQNNCLILFRPHLNSDLDLRKHLLANLRIVSSFEYPDTETLLLAVDVLITDWSSIFTDFLPLGRPIIFLDTKPGFVPRSLQPEDRAGTKVKTIDELRDSIKANLEKNQYLASNNEHVLSVTQKAWGATLDGKSCRRYYENISNLMRSRYQ